MFRPHVSPILKRKGLDKKKGGELNVEQPATSDQFFFFAKWRGRVSLPHYYYYINRRSATERVEYMTSISMCPGIIYRHISPDPMRGTAIII